MQVADKTKATVKTDKPVGPLLRILSSHSRCRHRLRISGRLSPNLRSSSFDVPLQNLSGGHPFFRRWVSFLQLSTNQFSFTDLPPSFSMRIDGDTPSTPTRSSRKRFDDQDMILRQSYLHLLLAA